MYDILYNALGSPAGYEFVVWTLCIFIFTASFIFVLDILRLIVYHILKRR